MTPELLGQFALGFGAATPLVFLLGYLLHQWFTVRLKESVAQQYKVELETLRSTLASQLEHERAQNEIRTRASSVADLVSEWLSWPDQQKHLNKLTLEAFLWMPDEILADLSDILAKEPNAKDIRHVILQARKHLIGETNLPAQKVIIFVQETKKRATAATFKSVGEYTGMNTGNGPQGE